MDKKHLFEKTVNAFRISLEAGDEIFLETCEKYNMDDFDNYWEGLLPKDKAREIESHCLDCPLCIRAMAIARDVHEKTSSILREVSDDDFINIAADLIQQEEIESDMFHRETAISPLLEEMQELARAVDVLEQRLETRIFGQTSALRAFVNGLRASLARPIKEGYISGNFLIFGPNGSGKSELIKILDKWINEYKANLKIKHLIHCEGYLQNVLPTLRNRILSPEPSIIVLSEFEKYEPMVLDVLMGGMDRAVLQLPDRHISGKLHATDIRGTIIILIGNVGRIFWGRLPFKEMEILPDRERVKEILEEEALMDQHLKSDVFQRRLSRAFLDRIDHFIPFCQLRYADVSKILDREVTSFGEELKKRGIQLDIDLRVKNLVVLASYYKRAWSARQAQRGFKEHIENPVQNALMRFGMKNVKLVSMDKTFNLTLRQCKPKILVIDDDWQNVCEILTRGLDDTAEVVGVPNANQALNYAAEKPFDLVLLDLYYNGELLWKDYLLTWRSAQPETPVVLLSGKVVSSAERLEIDQMGGVLGFLEKSADPTVMVRALTPYIEHATWLARIRAFENQYGFGGDRVLFDTRISEDSNDILIRYSEVGSVISESDLGDSESPILPSETRREIDEFLDIFLDARKRTELNIQQPKGLLLYGSPGNGKTMIARNVAQRMRCNFIAVSAADFQSRWAGVASERLKDLFEKARTRQPCVLFIDEIDAVAPHREESSASGLMRDQAATVAMLLTELDGFTGAPDIFLIGATNRKGAIDEALLRPGRIDRFIEMENPGLKERKQLLERALSHILHDPIDLDWAAGEAYGLSCAQIIRSVQDSVLVASRRLQENQKKGDTAIRVRKEDLRQAMDRLWTGASLKEDSVKEKMLKESREMRAWHEGGHLILSISLLGEIPNRVTIIPRGRVSGYVRYSEEDILRRKTFRRRSSCLAEISVLLAGGVAEELKFKEHSSGVSNDRQDAMRIAHAMIVKWGMGPLVAEVEGFLSRARFEPEEDTAVQIVAHQSNQKAVAKAVSDIIEEARELSAKELEKHRIHLEHAVNLLLEKEELEKADIEKEFKDLIAEL
ncbi:AAA family ATPase [Thermodesulfobacteriota bacterium]